MVTMAETSVENAADTVDDKCTWCGETAWRYKCAMCDPRTTKRLCGECATRWHSSGFSKQHTLENREGVQQSYLQWLANMLSDPAERIATANSVEMSNETMSSENLVDGLMDEDKQTEQSAPHEAVEPMEEVEIEYGDNGGEQLGAEEEVAQDIPPHLSEETQLDLEDVLDRLPSHDGSILDALADHTHDAIRIEDAVLCDQYVQCQEAFCQEVVVHYRHTQERKVCSEKLCHSIASYLTHMEFCKNANCPFCVRIQQRRLFGKKHGLARLIQLQRQQLQSFHQENHQSQILFAKDQIASFERRKSEATKEVEVLNRLVVAQRLPTFNFPRFAWHVVAEPLIKMEPGVAHETQQVDGATNAANGAQVDVSPGTEPMDVQEEQQPSSNSGAPDVSSSNAVAVGSENSESESDFLVNLIAKKDSGDPVAKAQLEESIQHAFRIVDATFCSGSKASRCLLNCQRILVHMQHHVDLAVCKDSVCEAVEHHFSHVFKCQNDGTERSCEYCLRVTEREFARAVEVMEAERPETETKLKRLIDSITDSLANDPYDEREQNVMQLEDELQQAEDYKKALLSKIDGASLNLVKARRRLKRHAACPPSSVATGLPLHFIKMRPPSPNKKRRMQ